LVEAWRRPLVEAGRRPLVETWRWPLVKARRTLDKPRGWPLAKRRPLIQPRRHLKRHLWSSKLSILKLWWRLNKLLLLKLGFFLPHLLIQLHFVLVSLLFQDFLVPGVILDVVDIK
jgi:hypothetical protein